MPVFPAVPSTTVPPGLILAVQRMLFRGYLTGNEDVQAFDLCVPNESKCSTVFDTSSRILEFSLSKYLRSSTFRKTL